MRKIFLSLLFILSGLVANAANPGTTCATAIELGDNFSEVITGPKTVWYYAWTFDLPLSVYFIPANATDPKPEVEMDFSCSSGNYEDSIICSLFCKNSGSGIQFNLPYRADLKATTVDGQQAYYLAMGKEYRDLLLKAGISYNVQVFVKVVYKSAGVISIAPDDMFTSCMDGAKFMQFGDTVHVKANDTQRHVIVPYVQWQEDSIRYVWSGTAPCEVAVAGVCEFDPTDYFSQDVLERENLQAVDTAKVTSQDMSDWVEFANNEAGMFFAKFYTQGTGVMKIERIPMAPPQGGATLLRYDKATPVDTSKIYAIPYTWTTATRFDVYTNHIFKMYVGTTHDFLKENAIASYQFSANNTGHWLGLVDAQMQALWTNTTEQYLYIRFECTAKTNITPTRWAMSECMATAIPIYRPSTTINVAPGSYGAVYYRFYYREWKGGDMKFTWKNNTVNCPAFIGDTCSFAANKNDSHVVDNKAITKNGSWTILAADLAEYEDRVDEDGFLYIRFNPQAAGTMTISTTAPEEVDPAPMAYPAATVFVVCNGEPTPAGQVFTVSVSASQTLDIYPGPANDIASRTPIETWTQTPAETHNTTPLPTGVYTLIGENESIQIEVK